MDGRPSLWALAEVSACLLPLSPPKTDLIKIKFSLLHHSYPRWLEPKQFPGRVSERLGVSVTCTQSVVKDEFFLLPLGRADSLLHPKLTSCLSGCFGGPRTDTVGPGADVLGLVLL